MLKNVSGKKKNIKKNFRRARIFRIGYNDSSRA